MARTKPLQSSFGAGELDPQLIMRRDTEQYKDGAKSLRNCRVLVGGGVTRRPGTARIADLAYEFRGEDWVVNQNLKYSALFSDGRVDFYLEDGTAAGSLTGCPWTGNIWRTMDYCQESNTAFLTHPSMAPQVVTRATLSTWNLAAYTFYSDYGGRTTQPYYKLAPSAMTLAPSAVTGAGITLALSGAGWFTSGHIGQIIRYHKREILITAVASALSATGTVIEDLPQTMELTVGFITGFAVGQVVEGTVTAAKGVITSLAAGKITVVLLDSKTGVFFATTDNVVSPTATQKVTAIAFAATLGAVTDWDEALFTPHNGYPACVELHRNRLVFAGHTALPNAIMASAIDNLYNHDVGDGTDGDAIFEIIGDAGASAIVQLHSAEQLLVFTDKGCYSIPETPAQPFRPSSVAFYFFGSPWPVATARSQDFDSGVVFVSGSSVIKARPVGDSQRSWAADEVSLLSAHLINSPSDTCVAFNFAGGQERYHFSVNADGTLAVMQLIEAQRVRSFAPWDTNGLYKSVWSLGSTVFACVDRTINGVRKYVLERFDASLNLDCTKVYSNLAGVATDYGSTPVRVQVGTYSLGGYPLTIADPPPGPYTVGLFFDQEIETLPPHIEDARGAHDGEKMRIVRAWVGTIESARFAANGYELQAYDVTDDPSAAPPLRDGFQKFSFRGWRTDPTILITNPDALPLKVPGIKLEVAY